MALRTDVTARKCTGASIVGKRSNSSSATMPKTASRLALGKPIRTINSTLLTENAFGSDPAHRIGTACWDHALDVEAEPEKWRPVWAALDARESFRDFVYCTMDGSGAQMYVKASGKPVFDNSGNFRGYRGTGSDVTAIVRGQRAEASLRTVQAELAHVSRVMTLGQLTASIAHEVNQPIGSARNNARAALNFLDRSPPELGEVKRALDCIVADADRAGGIIDRIRDQIKKVPPRSDRFDLNRAIEEVIGLAQTTITENGVSVQSRLECGMGPVHGDRVQLQQQVVLKLILNAVEAMSLVEADERQLFITTDQNEATGTLVTVLWIPGPELIRSILNSSSGPFTARNPVEWGWACQSADQSLLLTEAGCGPPRPSPGALYFSLRCLAQKRSHQSPGRSRSWRAARRHRFKLSSSTGFQRIVLK